MNEEIDESEFYHQDFTTASDWELFVARLEEIIHDWRNEDVKTDAEVLQSSPQGVWSIRSDTIFFVDTEFIFSYYKNTSTVDKQGDDEANSNIKIKHPIDSEHNFILDDGVKLNAEFCIPIWYGLNEFILLSTVKNEGITSESKIKILLSSLNIAIGNTGCNIPLFVQIREKWQKCYLGVCEVDNIRTNFEMIHLQKGPLHCQYLTGLLDLFKTKIMSPISLDPVAISVQFTYTLSDFGNFTWKNKVLDSESENYDIISLCALPFGVSHDPVNAMQIKCSWLNLQEHLVVDSENYTDFDPLQAQKWSLLSLLSEPPVCLLSECLSDFLTLINSFTTIYETLGDFITPPTTEGSNPLDLLTEPKVPTLSTVLKRAARNSLTSTRSKSASAPLAEEVLVPLLYFLFPDAEENSTFPYTEQSTKLNETSDFENLSKGLKTCNSDSLVTRLAIVLAQALNTLGGSRSLAHLWFEFYQEMRYRWEKSVIIPGLAPGFPDPRTCLLHQKLQMLNCCIERKKAREARESGSSTSEQSGSKAERNSSSSSTDEDEFFDCSDDAAPPKREYSLWNRPVGRLGKFGNLKLIETGDSLYIPVTQEPAPKTEDQLEEESDVLLKLGSDAQGSELRARMMSASLLSDMESFKAANPGSILEDFIRWYSPRDFIEEDELDNWGQKKGHLSSRMLISDNTWVQMWASAKPVPSNRQKRLFDDTREAEKVLHFLDSRKLSQIVELLLPVLGHAALLRLYNECQHVIQELPDSIATIRHAVKILENASREGAVNTRRYENLIKEISSLELKISEVNSLMYKFNPSGTTNEALSKFVGNLIQGREVEIEGKGDSLVGSRIVAMLCEAQKSANFLLTDQTNPETTSGDNQVFPNTTQREFVMRVDAVRPAMYSTKSPQFLRAILSKHEFRMVGAFSEDTVFF